MKTVTCLVFSLLILGSQISCFDERKDGPRNAPANQVMTVNATDDVVRCDENKSGIEYARAGLRFRDEGFPAKAVSEFECAIEKGYMTTDYREEYALALRDIGRHREVIEQCKILLQENSNSWRGHFIMIDSLISEGRFEEALSHLEISQELDSDPIGGGTYLYKHARILDGLDRTEEAIAAYEKYLEWGNRYDPSSEETRKARLRLEELKARFGA